MWSYLLRRVGGGAITLFALTTVAFFLTRLTPGSPFTAERRNDPEYERKMDEKYGRHLPLWRQYLESMGGYVRGDFGPSWKYDFTVNEKVWPAFRVSAQLGAVAALLALLLGIPLGVFAAAGRNRWGDHLAMSGAILGICVPNFLLGPLLVLCFSFWLKWLAPTGWPQSWELKELSKLIMPAFTLALVHVAYLSRLTRAGMLDVLHQDYIRTARAKGVGEFSIFLKHALKNGVTPALSYSGPMAAYIVTGSLVVERVFNIPGLGKEFVNASLARDMPVLMGGIIVYGVLVILFNALVDLMYAVLDPRVRTQ
jgi:oligopeptide transport system permease protein